jgi:hypothetical protein
VLAAAKGMTLSQFLLANEVLRLVAVREVHSAACPDDHGEGLDLYIISKERRATPSTGEWINSVSWRGYVSGLCDALSVPVRRVNVVRRLRYSPPLQRVGLGRSHAAAVAHFLMQGYVARGKDSDGHVHVQATYAAIVLEEGLQFRTGMSDGGRSVLQRALRDALPSSKVDAKKFGMVIDCNPSKRRGSGAMGSRSYVACNRDDGVDPNLHDYGILNLFDYSHGAAAPEGKPSPSPRDLPARVIDIGREADIKSLNASDFIVAYAVRRKFAAEMLFEILLERCVILERLDVSEDKELQAESFEGTQNRWRAIVSPPTLRVDEQTFFIPSLMHLVSPNNKWCSLSEPVFSSDFSSEPVFSSDSGIATMSYSEGTGSLEETVDAVSVTEGYVAELWKVIFLISMDDQAYEYVLEENGRTVRPPAIDWEAVSRLFTRMNPGYRVQLVTEADAEDLVVLSFPQYFDMYAGMDSWRSRVVLLRYLLLYEFGGVVIDSGNQKFINHDDLVVL